MWKDFYEKYKTYSKHQIFEILKNKNDYQPTAVKAAEVILKEKNWESELYVEINKENQIYQEEIKEKAEYYNKMVEFQNDKNYFHLRIADVPKFEAILTKNNIDFFREDKNVGVQLDTYPTETYYFKNKDVAAVDKICKDLKLTTAPYSDIKPFFKFEITTVVIVVLILIIIVLLITR